MKIYLIGLPGVGKSTIGKMLADKLNYEYIDLDAYIEKNAAMFVDEIFANYGEKFFRDLETNSLIELNALDNVIISCGGGIVKNKRNKEHMNGVKVLLTAPLHIISSRIENSNIERPLIATNTIYDLYNERKKLYEEFKDYEFENLDSNTCVAEILERIGECNE